MPGLWLLRVELYAAMLHCIAFHYPAVTYVCRHSQYGYTLKNGLPRPYILGLLWYDTAKLRCDFPRINPNLKQVVDQSQDRSKREGGHEQGHKAKLDDCVQKTQKKTQALLNKYYYVCT